MSRINRITGAPGPRIYNLFPLLLGGIDRWCEHLPRIKTMGFNIVYVNPFHYPGFSGSLYAIKDPYRLNDLFADGRSNDEALGAFIQAAQKLGLRVMMDVVVNHVAKDALLIGDHPTWCRREDKGELYSPRVVDPGDSSKITVWGDLCELDYDRVESRDGLVEYWSAYLRHYLALGFSTFRCDAAYKVPAEIWRILIAVAREKQPDSLFFAETLGCTLGEIEALADCGFDYIFNSSKWWDFRSNWALDQYEQTRRIAASISFPESHDTPRLAAETGSDDPVQIVRHLKFRYVFAVIFSTGLMMPLGYEFGAKRQLNVVRTRPSDFEATDIYLSSFIAACNAMKAGNPVLNEEGPLRRITAPESDIVALLRETNDRSGNCALIVLNRNEQQKLHVDAGAILFETGGVYTFQDVTPETEPVRFGTDALEFDPLEIRVFIGMHKSAKLDGIIESAEKIDRLAQERVAIEAVWPEIDGGRHPIKRAIGDTLEVWADIFCDGHGHIAAQILYRPNADAPWAHTPMHLVENDRWRGHIPLNANARYQYTIEAWRDLFTTWREDFIKKRDAGQDIGLELAEGRAFVAAAKNSGHALEKLGACATQPELIDVLLAPELLADMARFGPRGNIARYRQTLEVVVDRSKARFASWYELFPRSMSDDVHRHGTFDDVIRHLPYIRDMGFDVLYMPPIHPIGHTFRKGRNNAVTAQPGEPGSPYAIGSDEGGHDAIHPELGDFESFRRLVEAAGQEGIEIALDFAIQCSPDHPWIKQHPEWFEWRPDGTLKYAENPPKKYQDIVNFDFYGAALPSLWLALRDVVLFWIDHGVSTFRVDNPHTKPVPFWEWMIADVQARHPQAIFLAEAFTAPKLKKKLAKAGFTQSYTYFTWRHTKAELTEYLTELTRDAPGEYLRPNLFVNTPDINPPFLQTGGRAAFQIRAVLAGTLSSVWGMYSGFELCEATPIAGKEEYLDSEKYEIKAWDWDRHGNIRGFITRLNHIRSENAALHALTNLRFYNAHNDNVLFYGKRNEAGDNVIWIAVNLDPYNPQETTIELPLHELGNPQMLEAEELLSETRVSWQGGWQTIRLDPSVNPCAIWRVAPGRP